MQEQAERTVIEFKRLESEAWRSLDLKQFDTVLECASQLISAGDPWMVAGYMLRGLAHEQRVVGSDTDFSQAIDSYRHAAILAPCAASYQYLARALMKQGHDHYAEAFRFLTEAEKIEHCPEITLGFAKYYRTKMEPDLDVALVHYKRAAWQGRFRGFLGAAEIHRERGQVLGAIAFDILRITLAPFLWIFYGRRALFEF